MSTTTSTRTNGPRNKSSNVSRRTAPNGAVPICPPSGVSPHIHDWHTYCFAIAVPTRIQPGCVGVGAHLHLSQGRLSVNASADVDVTAAEGIAPRGGSLVNPLEVGAYDPPDSLLNGGVGMEIARLTGRRRRGIIGTLFLMQAVLPWLTPTSPLASGGCSIGHPKIDYRLFGSESASF